MHGAPGAREPPHGGSVALVLQSAALGPVMVPAVKVMVEVPTLMILTEVETFVPTVLLRTTGDGVNSTPVAIPERAAVCGLVASLSNTLNVPIG